MVMIKRQSFRLSSTLILLLPYHHRHQHRFCFRGGCGSGLMAAAFSLLVGNKYNDPFLLLPIYKAQPASNPHATYPSHPGNLSSLSSTDSITNVGRCMNWGLKACSFDSLERPDNNINGNSALRRARASTPCLSHLLRDSEIGLEDNRDTRSFNGVSGGAPPPSPYGGAYYRGSSLGFPSDHPLLDKIVVAVDVDEVLGSFLSALNKFMADRYLLNHSLSEYHVYEFFKATMYIISGSDNWLNDNDIVLIVTADIRVHEFFKTSYFRMGIHPIPGAQQALQNLSKYCSLSVVTSRQNAIKDHTIEWIEKHYPGLFQEIHFGNHFALDGQSRPKSDICRYYAYELLIRKKSTPEAR
ncbi:unnamed protein product [Ilex paraguariensis]|uniref:Uncharacterized protein n=1 Tax=Ilex paraguariensis TaxID=185542 RepID=A0ABC8RGE9_9AQUA